MARSNVVRSDGRLTRGKTQRASDMSYIARLYSRGYKVGEIAEKMSQVRDYDVSAEMVRSAITEVRRLWRSEYLMDMDEWVARELGRLDELEKSYWEAWDKSVEDWEARIEEEKVGENKFNERSNEGMGVQAYNMKKTIVESKRSIGDPRYLDGVRRCIEQRSKLLGLEPPKIKDIDWRDEARRAGIENAGEVFNELVRQFVDGEWSDSESGGGVEAGDDGGGGV